MNTLDINKITYYDKKFSVIIPHRNSLHFLPKLFSTIPNSEDIEILLVDNSPIPISKSDLNIDKEYTLLYSSPERGAGGARNVGLDNAHGKWIIFIDADDYLTNNAFDTFFSQYNSDSEIIYFCMDGVYIDTGEQSNRGEHYTQLTRGYINGTVSELSIRLDFPSPCSKMISHDLINRHHIRFDEVVASNDVFFSLLTGFYAKKISAIDKITYIATVSRGTLTRRRDYCVLKSRYEVRLRRNKFLKEHNLNSYQTSIMHPLFLISKISIKYLIECLYLLFIYRQNPFIGCRNWLRTLKNNKQMDRKESKYITK